MKPLLPVLASLVLGLAWLGELLATDGFVAESVEEGSLPPAPLPERS